MKTENEYTVYDYDRLTPGHSVKIEHTVYSEGTDLSNLLSLSLAEVITLKESNIAKEQKAYEKAIDGLKEWESLAAITGKYEKAIDYLTVPEVSHTSNKWEKDKYDKFTISNKVYKMTYDIYERSSYRTDAKKYDVRWSICTNRPPSQSPYRVANQERVCSSREEAEKYIQGRIKAYSHLFTEISPPIPKEYEKSFMVHGHLLPGYITEEMQKAQEAEKPKNISRSADKKPSIRKELNSIKAAEKNKTEPAQTKKRSSPEL